MSQHQLRIGDRERDAAVTALGEHFVAGRLTKEEYDDRSSVAWRARTHSDLAPLFVDLPALHQTRGPQAPSVPGPAAVRGRQVVKRPQQRRGFRFPLLPLLLVLVGLAMLTDVAVVLVVVGVLWWTGFFGWLRRTTSPRWDRRFGTRC